MQLRRSLECFTIENLPVLFDSADVADKEIYKRVTEYINSANELHADHCDLCKQEFVDSVNGALGLIVAYVSGMLTNPKKIWTVTYKSNDGQNGQTKIFTTDEFEKKDGYTISSINTSWFFQEELPYQVK